MPQQRSRTLASGRGEDGAEGAGGAVPPAAVEAEGEEVVGAVVGGRDGVEHLLDVRCGGLLGGGAGGDGRRWSVRARGWVVGRHAVLVLIVS